MKIRNDEAHAIEVLRHGVLLAPGEEVDVTPLEPPEPVSTEATVPPAPPAPHAAPAAQDPPQATNDATPAASATESSDRPSTRRGRAAARTEGSDGGQER